MLQLLFTLQQKKAIRYFFISSSSSTCKKITKKSLSELSYCLTVIYDGGTALPIPERIVIAVYSDLPKGQNVM